MIVAYLLFVCVILTVVVGVTIGELSKKNSEIESLKGSLSLKSKKVDVFDMHLDTMYNGVFYDRKLDKIIAMEDLVYIGRL